MNAQDAELLPKLLDGEQAAIRLLVATHHRSLTRFARSIVGAANAEDVVQEAWIKILNALPSFEGRSTLRQWLFTIVRNEAIGRLRRDARTIAPDSHSRDDLGDRFDPDGKWRTPPSAWSFDTPEALLAAKEMRGVLEKTLEGMPSMQRAVVVLRDVEGLSFEEVCNILEVSASNARVLLHRGRRRLWAAVDEYQKVSPC
jgi:RNA polymerase sigma-70 factor (ECF subfamily)